MAAVVVVVVEGVGEGMVGRGGFTSGENDALQK